MRNNPAFTRAISGLTHPINLSAMAILLFNDQYLRIFHPSWLSGKLGDIAWLTFFPFLVATIISYFVPRRQRENQFVGIFSITLVGIVFALGKTVPAFNQLIMQTFSHFLDIQLVTLVDPSDLVALPALWICWQIWAKTKPGINFNIARGMAALPLAALLTLGNTARFDLGVVCILQQDTEIYIPLYYSSGNGYISNDGGLTWIEGTYDGEITCLEQDLAYPQEIITKSGQRYRYAPEEDIEISIDNGKTWATAFNIHPISEAQQELYDKKGFNGITKAGPLAALEDSKTGNIIFAMGWEGVLVHNKDTWQWISVGEYQQLIPQESKNLFTLLNLRLILAVTSAMMIILAAAKNFDHGRLWRFFYYLSWIAWGICVFTAIWDGKTYLEIIPLMAILAGGILILIMALSSIIRLAQQTPDVLTAVFVTALTAMIVFAFPYLLWVYNIIPQYILAMIASVVLFFVVLLPSQNRFKNMIINALKEE